MHRLALISVPRRGPLIPSVPTGLSTHRAAAISLHNAGRTYATSSPKEAEAASAQSGGSRSKDAAEGAELGEAKGRTGGGDPLSSSENPPPRPKIHNASVPGQGKDRLSKEQQEEVDRHNAEFEKKHDRAATAGDDKVDKEFWKGGGER